MLTDCNFRNLIGSSCTFTGSLHRTTRRYCVVSRLTGTIAPFSVSDAKLCVLNKNYEIHLYLDNGNLPHRAFLLVAQDDDHLVDVGVQLAR